ncbi:MAG TPA: hypothetical protein PKD61_23805, partial [Polyangiaceae bacterium]|nr:hypothetical protein [Polyangiaceae bacterium]
MQCLLNFLMPFSIVYGGLQSGLGAGGRTTGGAGFGFGGSAEASGTPRVARDASGAALALATSFATGTGGGDVATWFGLGWVGAAVLLGLVDVVSTSGAAAA